MYVRMHGVSCFNSIQQCLCISLLSYFQHNYIYQKAEHDICSTLLYEFNYILNMYEARHITYDVVVDGDEEWLRTFDFQLGRNCRNQKNKKKKKINKK